MNSRDVQSSPITPSFVVFVCNSSFSLQTELSAPPPGLGPFPSPLLGGFPGTSLLIGQHAASLQLAQLKTQLALTQINSALAVGSQTPAFKANSKPRARYKRSAAPSPTAVAINLLNLLKIANNMSHPLYNPCGSGNQKSAQRQYDYSNAQPETARLGSDPSFSSSASPGTSGMIVPSLTSLSYRLNQRNTVNDESALRSADSTRAREVRPLGMSVQQTNQGVLFASRDTGEIGPLGTNMSSLQTSSASASQGHGGTGVQNDSSSLEWLNYKRPARETSAHGDEQNLPYIPGLGDDSHMVPEELPAAAPSSQPSYTAETATSILRQYGLDKEDLEYLISYPEDQMTLANMQKILQQRCLEKAKTTMAASQTKTYPQPTKSVSASCTHSSSSAGPGLSQKARSPPVPQQSKVIDYGHTRRYNVGASDGVGRTSDSAASCGPSGSVLLLDPCGGSRQQPQEKNKKGANGASSGSLHIPGLSLLGRFNKPAQTSEKAPRFSPLPKADADLNVLAGKSTKAGPVKEPGEDERSPPSSSCVLLRGMHPGRPGLVLISNNKRHDGKEAQMAQQPAEQRSKPQTPRDALSRTATWPSGYSASQKPPPAPDTSRSSEALWTTRLSPGGPPLLHQPFPAQGTIPDEQPEGNVTPLKGLPTLAMVHDYAAASPRVFPHACSLCYKDCAGMKVSRRLHSVVSCPV